MSYKVLRNIGVILTALCVLGFAGMVIFWFVHYYVMQEGYYGFGDSFMICCCISGIVGVIGQLGLPLIIISFVVKGTQTKHSNHSALNTQQQNLQTAQPVTENVTQQNVQNTESFKTENSYCGMCGAQHSAQARFCPYCGNKLS